MNARWLVGLVALAACRYHFDDVSDAAAFAGPPGIFRSVGFGTTAPLATGAGNPVRIADSIASFALPLGDQIGVGDALQFDVDGDGMADTIAFVYARRSSTSFDIATEAGGPTLSSVAGSEAWAMFRAHTSLDDAVHNRANPSIGVMFDRASDVRDLVKHRTIWNIACYADAPHVAQTTVQGWTTSADSYMHIFTPVRSDEVGVSQRHRGAWADTAFEIVTPAGSNDLALIVHDAVVTIDGLQIFVDTDGAPPDLPFGIEFADASTPLVDRVTNTIVRGSGVVGNGSLPRGIFLGSALVQITLLAWNNEFFNIGDNTSGYAIEIKMGNAGTVYNNTSVNVRNGLRVEPGSSAVARNNVAIGCVNCFNPSGGVLTGADNFSEDTSAQMFSLGTVLPTGDPHAYFRSATDFHLDPNAPSVGSLIDGGLDLSMDPVIPFTTDIDGVVRTGGWDVGADQLGP